MKIIVRLPWLLLCLCTGCFPVDLDVNAKGEMLIPRQEGFFLFQPNTGKATQIRVQGGGQPVFARFDPLGENVLLIAKQMNKEKFLEEFRFDLVPLKGGDARTVYAAPDAGEVRFSPDGTKLAVILYRAEGFKQKKPELHLVDVRTGDSKLLLKKAASFVRWFADSKRLLTFQLENDKDSLYRGEIVIVHSDDGNVTSLASAIALRESSLDLSPNNQKVVFTANRVGAVGAQLQPDNTLKKYLFELDIATQKIRELKTEAKYVRFSPSGKKILLTSGSAGFSFVDDLVIADADLSNRQTIARDVYDPVITFSAEQIAIPGWIDDERVFYFTGKSVYGKSARSLHLMMLDADGKNKKYLQPDIDMAVDSIVDAAEALKLPKN